MSEQEDVFQLRTYEGEEVCITDISGGEVKVRPQSQALSLRWPRGGIVWNRPVAILVEQNGVQRRMPIVDVTRLAQIVLLGLCALFGIMTAIFMLRRPRKE